MGYRDRSRARASRCRCAVITRNTVITLHRVLRSTETMQESATVHPGPGFLKPSPIAITITIVAERDEDAKRFEQRAKLFLERELGE